MSSDYAFLARQIALVSEQSFEALRASGCYGADADHIARRFGYRPLKPPPHSGAGPSETAAARAARHDRKNGTIPELAFRLRTRFGGT